MVTSLPSSNANKRWAYARAEYRNAKGQRRVLVWSLAMATQGRSGAISLREDRGANDLPGTRTAMRQHELLGFLVRLEAAGRITVAGEEVAFPPHLLGRFVEQCRARLEDAKLGRLTKTGPFPDS